MYISKHLWFLEHGLCECSWTCSYSISKSLAMQNPNKSFSNGWLRYGTKGKSASLCYKGLYVTFDDCGFKFYASFLLSSSVCSTWMIKYKLQVDIQPNYSRSIHSWCMFICVHPKGEILTWYNTADSRTWLMHIHLKHYETSETLCHGRSFHVLKFLHCSKCTNEPEKI